MIALEKKVGAPHRFLGVGHDGRCQFVGVLDVTVFPVLLQRNGHGGFLIQGREGAAGAKPQAQHNPTAMPGSRKQQKTIPF